MVTLVIISLVRFVLAASELDSRVYAVQCLFFLRSRPVSS
jgi:hypothetical protein